MWRKVIKASASNTNEVAHVRLDEVLMSLARSSKLKLCAPVQFRRIHWALMDTWDTFGMLRHCMLERHQCKQLEDNFFGTRGFDTLETAGALM